MFPVLLDADAAAPEGEPAGPGQRHVDEGGLLSRRGRGERREACTAGGAHHPCAARDSEAEAASGSIAPGRAIATASEG